jgi:hypothetical protein
LLIYGGYAGTTERTVHRASHNQLKLVTSNRGEPVDICRHDIAAQVSRAADVQHVILCTCCVAADLYAEGTAGALGVVSVNVNHAGRETRRNCSAVVDYIAVDGANAHQDTASELHTGPADSYAARVGRVLAQDGVTGALAVTAGKVKPADQVADGTGIAEATGE